MKEQIISKSYAKALIDLAKDTNVSIADELTKLSETINKSNDLESLLFLDVFTGEEKSLIVNEVVTKLGLSSLVKNFINFLIDEKRLGLFPLIFKEIVVIDDHNKGFLRGVIEGYDENVSPEIKNKLLDVLKPKLGANVELEYKKNENITAGYRVTVEDLQLDASVDNQLSKLKDNILNL